MRISPLSRTGLLFSVSILLGACASTDELIEREFAAVDDRLARIEARIAEVERAHTETRQTLSRQQRSGFAALMQTTVAEVDRLVRERPPAPIVITAAATPASEQPGKATPPSASAPSPAALRIADKQVIGGIERVHLSPPGLTLEARIDTGAESSSLDARNIREFERDGSTWVRFLLVDRDTDEVHEIERRVVRFVRILQSSVDDSERRPVVRFRMALGTHVQVAEFTLSDREHLAFPVLIGRNVLKDVMIVDVGRSHLAPVRAPEREDGAADPP